MMIVTPEILRGFLKTTPQTYLLPLKRSTIRSPSKRLCCAEVVEPFEHLKDLLTNYKPFRRKRDVVSANYRLCYSCYFMLYIADN